MAHFAGEIVHTDVCGPMSIPTKGGARYFITFTDDESRFTKIFLLETKDQSITAFKKYYQYAKTMQNQGIKRIHHDLGSEFFTQSWKDFCDQNGITQTSAPRVSPNKNAIPEVVNRILMVKARAMMADANAPRNFWGYAVETATLLKNIALPLRMDEHHSNYGLDANPRSNTSEYGEHSHSSK